MGEKENKKQKNNMDLLSGSIWDKALKFAVPLLLTGILQQLFSATDVAIVGRFVGPTAMAAVGSNAPVIGLVINAFVGIAVGANVVIARCIGQNNYKRVQDATHTAIVLSFVCGIIVAILGTLLTRPLLTLIGVPDDVIAYSTLYLRIYFLGAPFIMLYNFLSAIFRSVGNTRTPLICLATGGVFNVICNLFFILELNMTVDGVAYATVIANIISTTLLCILLRREKSAIHLDFDKLKINVRLMKQMLAIGLPSGLQGMVFSIANLSVQSAVNSLGSDVMAASSAAFYVEIFVFFVSNAFGQACVTFIGQNYGAGNLKRCKKIANQIALMNLAFTIAFSMAILAAGPYLLGIFSSGKTIIAIGMTRMRWMMLGQFLSSTMETYSGVLRGLGESVPPAVITLVVVCGTRVAWVYTIFQKSHTLGTLMACYPISWFLATCALIFVYMRFARKYLVDKEP